MVFLLYQTVAERERSGYADRFASKVTRGRRKSALLQGEKKKKQTGDRGLSSKCQRNFARGTSRVTREFRSCRYQELLR